MKPINEKFSIKQWSENDRPREKLLNKGRNSLSDAELLAILIGSGNRNENAVDLCKRILKDHTNKLSEISKLSVEQLQQYVGIGEAKAISIIAALEIGKRRRLEEALNLDKIKQSNDVFELMHPVLGDLSHEEFWILLLNNSNKVIGKHSLSKGGITGTVVDARLVFKKAIEKAAVSIILVHNHPSGALYPSNADIQLTKSLKSAGEILQIKVLDHIIVTQESYYSFADEGNVL